MLKVIYQLSSAAQRYLETQLTASSSSNDVATIVPMATAVLVSHSSSWPTVMARLDVVYDHLLDCYSNNSRGTRRIYILILKCATLFN